MTESQNYCMIKRKAYAKINLALDVLGKLSNGYHEVKMVMQTIDLYDVLYFTAFDCGEISKAGNTDEKNGCNGRIKLCGTGNDELSMGPDNLIYKAAAAMLYLIPAEKGVEIRLEKNIPMAAGMAGGSTDAAATLHGINELFGLGLTCDELCEIGIKLGADVPYCVKGGTMLAEGIGEKLTKLPDAPKMILVVAKPEAGVSTKYVYEHLDACDNPGHPDVDGMITALHDMDIHGISEKLGNILEAVTIPACPEVAEIKKVLSEEGAEGVLMSGSGPTVFGIFTDEKKADSAAKRLEEESPAEFVTVTETVK